MIDKLLSEFINATDSEREEFHRRVSQAGTVSAEGLAKAACALSEIARSIKE